MHENILSCLFLILLNDCRTCNSGYRTHIITKTKYQHIKLTLSALTLCHLISNSTQLASHHYTFLYSEYLVYKQNHKTEKAF